MPPLLKLLSSSYWNFGQALQNSVGPTVPATYIPCGGGILAYTNSFDGLEIKLSKLAHLGDECNDDEHGVDEEETEHWTENRPKSAEQDTVAEVVDQLRALIPPRPHLLGMGWLGGEHLANEIEHFLGC